MDRYFSRNAAVIRESFTSSFEISPPKLVALPTLGIETLETLLALVLLVLFTPILLLCALAIKMTSKGPVFYRQQRVGKNGEVFSIVKLRSMRTDAENKTGPVLSWKMDPRVTPIGGFLRKTHLDEVPQLWNVFMGEMSLVGPRPERPYFVQRYRGTIPRYRLRETVSPGITGLAQVCCGYDAKPEEKLEFDLRFIQYRNSWLLHARIFLYTIGKVLFAHSP